MRTTQIFPILAIMCLSGVALADEWDAAADFTAAGNPNGDWSYGYAADIGVDLTLHALSVNDATWNIWGSGNWLQAYKNVSNTTNGGCQDWCVQPGELAIHPSSSGLWSVVRFTAPYDGAFTVSASFAPADMQISDITVGIAGPAGALLTDSLTSYSDTVTFDETVTLLAGETVDFGVHMGQGSYFNDGTIIDVIITGDPAPACGNLVTNGSFEDSGPDQGWHTGYAYNDTLVTGWVVEGGSVDLGNYCPAYWESTHGIHNIDLNGGSAGTLSQSFATIPGAVYDFSFRMGANNYCGVPTPTVRVSAGDTVEDFTFDRGPWNGTPLTADQWASYGFTFTALSSQTTLTFQSLTGSCGGPTLDSIWVDASGCGGGWPEETNCFLPVTDSDGDGVPDDQDGCAADPGKTEPGVCGCGTADTDSDGDNTADCIDGCPADGGKTESGVCGCGTADTDSDGDNTADCIDGCPADGGKTESGVCGCGTADTDSDGDNTADCIDNCVGIPNDQADADADGAGDLCDVCPFDAQDDADGDGVCGDVDLCSDTAPDALTKGLGVNRFADIDGDGNFDTVAPKGNGPQRSYTVADTQGCGCTQIIAICGYGKGHSKFGCSISVMDEWTDGDDALCKE